MLGEAALTDMDKLYAKFADEFEQKYVSQGYDTDRDIEETLDIGWKLLSILPQIRAENVLTINTWISIMENKGGVRKWHPHR